MKRLLLLALAAAAPILVSACSVRHTCTDLGCSSGISFRVAGLVTKYRASFPLVVRLCVDKICSTADLTLDASGAPACTPATGVRIDTCTFEGDTLEAPFTAALNRMVESSVLIEDGSGAKLFEETRTVATTVNYPNGEDCPPACLQGTVTYTP
jgi:hypothetical protein